MTICFFIVLSYLDENWLFIAVLDTRNWTLDKNITDNTDICRWSET